MVAMFIFNGLTARTSGKFGLFLIDVTMPSGCMSRLSLLSSTMGGAGIDSAPTTIIACARGAVSCTVTDADAGKKRGFDEVCPVAA